MILVIFACIALFGVIGLVLQHYAVRRFASRPAAVKRERLFPFFPPVSILKPLKGLDDSLFDNLESFCMLDYPEYEIIFSLQNRNDPAHKVAEKIRAKHPNVNIRIVVEYCENGLNPKVRNLMAPYREARYELVIISDSNVRVAPNYLREITTHMEDPSTGLVSNMIRGVGGRSLGARLENLHLNSFIIGSVCFLDLFLAMPCVVGKSMLIKKTDLEAIGGLDAVKNYLAEDYIIGERIHALGKKVVLSEHLIDNVNEEWGLGRFLNRHTRWAKLRWRIGGPKYLSELAGNPVFMSLVPLLLKPSSKPALLLATAVSLLKIGNDFLLGRRIGAGSHPFTYGLSPFKDFLIGMIWFIPLLSNTVAWRGSTYIIGKKSLLSPICKPESGGRLGILTAIKTRLALSKP